MDEEIKSYHLAREFRQNLALDEEEKMKAIRDNIKGKFIELENKTEKIKQNNILPEIVIDTSEELIKLCISRYGENLEKLEHASDRKVKEVYRALNNFCNELDKETNESLDKSIKEK